MKRYLTAHVRTDAAGWIDDPSAPVPWVASSPGVLSDGYDLQADAWDLTRYAKHGPVLWAHDYAGHNLPIGTGKARIEGDRLLIDVSYDEEDSLAQTIRKKAIKGMIGGSVGWDDVKVGNETKHQLLEFSNVPVPLDPTAGVLRQAAEAAYLARSVTQRVQSQVKTEIARKQAELERLLSLAQVARSGESLIESLERLQRL